MSVNKLKRSGGMTLLEIMVAMVVLAIAAIGALGYQYHAARHGNIAKLEMIATRTAQLLLEDWKSTGGDEYYDPSALGLGFDKTVEEGLFRVVVDDLPMYVRLEHRDVAHDSVASVTLREISVITRWRQDYKSIQPEADRDPSLILTTYVRRDASGG
jgi:prepilin-type N-terminal cleavage/methylation domain-containing protein